MSATPAPTPRSRCRWPMPRRHAGGVRGRAPDAATASSSRAAASWSRRSRSRASAPWRRSPSPSMPACRARRTPLEPVLTTPVFTTRAPHQPAERFEAAVYTREALLPGRPDRRARPWSAAPPRPSWSSPAGRSRSRRATTSCSTASSRWRAQVAVGTHCDPILLEIFNNLFMTIAEQMGVTLQSTAYSVNVKERLDFSCAVFAADGALVANAPHMPVHLGSMGQSVRTILELNRDRLRPGDVWALNNPYNGGTHLPDITVVMPVFDGRASWSSSPPRARTMPTSAASPRARCRPTARIIDQEGVLFDNFLLVENGQLREAALLEVLRSGPYPVRNETQNVADLQAQVAACQRGANELAKMVAPVRPRHRPRLHGPRPGQCRGERAPRARRAAGRRVHLRPRRRPGGEGEDLDRQGGAPGHGRLHRHQRAAALELQRARRGHPRRRALRLPHPGRRRHPDERGLPEADRHRPARGLDRLPAATRPRSAPAMSRPRNGSPTRSTARWACWPPRRAP